MIKRGLKLALVLGVTALGFAVSGQQASATSWLTGTKTTYSNVEHNGDEDGAKLFTTSVKSGKNAYVWNKTHTKRIHNLKNYRHTTWYAFKGISKNKQTYYYIKNQSGSVDGLVWGGYLRAYSTKTAKDFKTASAFENYIQTEPSQKLARAVLKQLNGIPVSYELSKYAAGRFGSFPTSITGFEDIIPLSTYTLPASDFSAIKNYPTALNPAYSKQLYWYWGLTYGQTVTSRAAKVATVMAAHNLVLSDYNGTGTKWRVGIDLEDNDSVSTLILAKVAN